jgi:hypothetical protein
MTDTLFDDVAEFQPPVDDRYTHAGIAFRSNDGIYQDRHFAANLAWAMGAVKHRVSNLKRYGRFRQLVFFIVYFVWEVDDGASAATLKARLGNVHRPRMAILIDVESWGGKIHGNHSKAINATREELIAWLHSLRPAFQRRTPLVNRWYKAQDRKRVIGYANAGDFANLWPDRGDTNVIIANYSYNPTFPRKIAHQYTDHASCAPFFHNDENSADGYSPHRFAAALGLLAYPRPSKPRHHRHRHHKPVNRPDPPGPPLPPPTHRPKPRP